MECIVRGYLAGTGWKEYQKTQSICGIPLPKGLRESEKLPEPIFTPTSKEEGGKHDENMTFDELVDEVGGPTILATLTVIAALLPMAFVSGLMGPYMSPIPINASLSTAASPSTVGNPSYNPCSERSKDKFSYQFILLLLVGLLCLQRKMGGGIAPNTMKAAL